MPEGADPVQWGLDRARLDQEQTLEAMNVAFDIWTSERELVARGAMEDVLAELCDGGMVYEADGATWLRTGECGDSVDRVLVKSDGEPTYFLPDIAYHHEKLSRCDLVIDILGADHHGYVGRIRAAIAALDHDPGLLRGTDRSERHSEPGRSGSAPLQTGRDHGADLGTTQRGGPDVTRLTYLLQSIGTTQTIDIAAISGPVSRQPRVLRAVRVRTHPLIGPDRRRTRHRAVPLDRADLTALESEREFDVLRVLAVLPEVVLSAARARAPHQVATWARDLAAGFHRFWHDCPILREEVPEDVRQARMWLVEATRVGLAVSLGILGVSAPERL